MGLVRVFSFKILSLIIISIIVTCVLYQFLISSNSANGKPGLNHHTKPNSGENVDGLLSAGHLSELEGTFGQQVQNTNEEKGHNERDDAREEIDEEDEDIVNVAMIFTKAQGNSVLKQKFIQSLSSMVKYSSCPLKLHIIGDQSSLLIARNIVLRESKHWAQSSIQVVPHDADEVAKKTEPLIGEILRYFIYKPGAYYSDTLFFFSIVLHKFFPLEKIILLDVDIKFQSDILDLYRHFNNFEPTNVIGIAREQQPVYRHVFHLYRKEHPGTKVGDPPPDGFTGFNSAVLLLHLQRMRDSLAYYNYLNASVVTSLVTKYKFQGHLGDQDFFTLVSLENPQLFYTLPCGWNRQLCLWWKGHGYEDVFDKYHNCDEVHHILHGNCNTIIP
ncbi:Glycosyltransferase-like 1B [Chamberlinius hualienensis]